jgi:DNA-binding response OmpR family regulator
VLVLKRALIADDTKNIRNLLTTCLEVNGYEVTTANNGEQALEEFKSNSFDFAFLDIKMPEISGTEVLRRVRALGIDTPIVMMTAFATVKNAVECTKLGAVAYLQKPFTADKVKNMLEGLENCSKSTDCDISSYFGKVTVLIEEGNLDEAYCLLKKVLSIDPTYAQCYNLIGKIHELKGNIHEANRFYTVSQQFDNK